MLEVLAHYDRAGSDVLRTQDARHARGCDHCSQTGYIGRQCIMEIMPMSDGLRSLGADVTFLLFGVVVNLLGRTTASDTSRTRSRQGDH